MNDAIAVGVGLGFGHKNAFAGHSRQQIFHVQAAVRVLGRFSLLYRGRHDFHRLDGAGGASSPFAPRGHRFFNHNRRNRNVL